LHGFDDISTIPFSCTRNMECGPRRTSHIIAGPKETHDLIRAALAYHETFVPATATRTFRIAATDVGQVVVVPAPGQIPS
jgi:hypothetical protein